MTSNFSNLLAKPVGSAPSRLKSNSKVGASNQPLRLHHWLKGQQDLARLAPVISELSALQRVLDLAHPLLSLQAISFKDDMLVIAAPSPSVAAKLRQTAPSLVLALNAASQASLETSGRKVNRIRFKPQMGYSGAKRTNRVTFDTAGRVSGAKLSHPQVQLPKNSLLVAEQMAEDCTNPKLKLVLTRIIKRQNDLIDSQT